jgi:hypothetical protein
LEEDSSDDEDNLLVPRDWDNYIFSQLSVNAGENVAWEYRENAVSVCDNPPRKIPYYRLNQSTLVIKQ